MIIGAIKVAIGIKMLQTRLYKHYKVLYVIKVVIEVIKVVIKINKVIIGAIKVARVFI